MDLIGKGSLGSYPTKRILSISGYIRGTIGREYFAGLLTLGPRNTSRRRG